jgi:hypothetical protein
MAEWGPTVAEELRRDVRFALTFKLGKNRRPLTDAERDLVAEAIVDHMLWDQWRDKHRCSPSARARTS